MSNDQPGNKIILNYEASPPEPKQNVPWWGWLIGSLLFTLWCLIGIILILFAVYIASLIIKS